MVDTLVQDNASIVEPVQTQTEPVVASTEPVKVVEPTAEEVLNKKIADAVKNALAGETENTKRAIQSAKDKAMAEVQKAERRTRLAETTLGATQQHLQSLDPETAKEFELAQLRAERSSRMSFEQEEQVRQQQTDFHNKFASGLASYAKSVGVEPNDPRLDWNISPTDYLDSQNRFLGSVAAIQNEKAKGLEASLEARVKETEKRIRKDLGLEEVNSVLTANAGGVSVSGIPTSMVAFRDWLNKLPDREYAKLKPEIDSMLEKGRIK